MMMMMIIIIIDSAGCCQEFHKNRGQIWHLLRFGWTGMGLVYHLAAYMLLSFAGSPSSWWPTWVQGLWTVLPGELSDLWQAVP